jgi:serine/threonine-protein kinase
MSDPVARLNDALAGRYRVERQLGEGGMATVYVADDLRHGRRVALKVLKPELAAVVGADRFLGEIRTTASLQHPHILPLFDSGQADGLLFYVMPRVEGESLREHLDREHQLPVDEAVRIATGVAEALDYAHRHGVIHRDIKPANILLLDGTPLIADFGIALAVSAGGAARLTETGLSLGTPHYMSPEQATGDQSVGPATDIWALGCVLYEMLAGDPPYTASTPQAVLGKIITSDLMSVSEARRSTPPNVDAAILKALEKVPADRFRSASDFAEALADPGFRHGRHGSVREGGSERGSWNRLSIGLAATAAVLAIALVWSAADSPRPEPRPVARFDVTPAAGQQLPVPGVDFALSPDGSRIVFVGTGDAAPMKLWQRVVEDLEAVPVAGTDGALGPVLSPDGLAVAFQASGTIKTVPLLGGPVTTLATGTNPAWGSDGTIYFIGDDIIYRVPETGGEVTAVTAPVEGYIQRYPHALPDGRGLLLTLTAPGPVPEQSRIAVVGPAGGEPRQILTGTMARYAASGHIVYATAEGSLMAAPFDSRRLEVTAPSLAVAEEVVVKGGSASMFALSESGTLLVGTGAGRVSELVWVSRAGEAEAVDSALKGTLSFPALSPDGSQLAFSLQEGSSIHIWVKQLDRGPSLKITFDGTFNQSPAWTPDGRFVTFESNQRGTSFDLWTTRADGGAPAALSLDTDRGLGSSLWSPDGEWLVFRTSFDDRGQGDILAVRPGVDAAPVSLIATEFREQSATLSPDGRFLAYSSNETGRHEIYVVPFPDASAGRWAVSTAGGTEPLWSHGGGELFYRDGQGDLLSVQVETNPTFSLRTTTPLFSATGYRANLNHRQYDVAPDDERFLMLRPTGEDEAPEWTLVLNFFEELRQRVPN